MTILGKLFRLVHQIWMNLCAICIRPIESFCFKTNRSADLQSPVFIIGAPRTGSTILYQALTNAYQFAYIDNIACKWHRNLRFGLWLSNRKFGVRPHDNFEADYGSTARFGGHAPSECGEFWYRWLPRDRHFIDYADVSKAMIDQIRDEILGASSYLRRPLLFKNLNAGQRLRLIQQAFPDAKILFVRRDPRFVVRSILKARRAVGIPEGRWWSIMPPNVDELMRLPEKEMCAAQMYYLERQIEKDLELFPKEQVREVHYQHFDSALIDQIGRWCNVPVREGGRVPEFHQDDSASLVPEEWDELAGLVAKYPFRKELFL